MKKLILTVILAFGLISPVWAVENDAAASAPAAPVEVGNKVCPVSGEKVGGMGEVSQIEYEGKVYNLCCEMCKKDFLKDPKKYIEKVDAEMKAGQ